MGRRNVGKWMIVVAAVGGMMAVGGPEWFPNVPAIASAAEDLSIENLPSDPKAFRAQVEQIVKKVDGLITKLKDNKDAEATLQDLIQTRDNVMREVFKVENAPDGAKWTAQEAHASVGAMLKLMRDQYEKAAEKAG